MEVTLGLYLEFFIGRKCSIVLSFRSVERRLMIAKDGSLGVVLVVVFLPRSFHSPIMREIGAGMVIGETCLDCG